MGTVFLLREIAVEDGEDLANIEIVGRDAGGVEIFHMRTGPQIDAGGADAGDSREQSRHVVAQQFPLLSVDVVTIIRG